jgi:hypothetical protein
VNALLFPALLAAGLFGPGWLLGRVLRTNGGAIGAFLGSAALLVNVVLGLTVAGITIDFFHLAIGLAAVCALLAAVARFRMHNLRLSIVPSSPAPLSWPAPRLLVVPLALGGAAMLVRAIVDPLSGFDTLFRWDFLAQQLFRIGTLNFYPPVSAADFMRYPWCDGIAPLVSTEYFWAYLSLGRIEPWATAPVVVAQAVLLFAVIFQLAAAKVGSHAGWWAAALASTCSILLWSVAMGQETGLTALSLASMLLFLERARAAPESGWLVWAGIAAGVGGLAREYGLAFVLIGLGTLIATRTRVRGLLQFATAAFIVAAPWYLRNWIRTGNPLYGHELGGLFPGNAVNASYFSVVGELRGLGSAAARPSAVAVVITMLAGVLLVFAACGMIARRRDCRAWIASMVVVATLWIWSIGQTSGGPVYALRVLTPLLAIGAAFGGIWLSQQASARLRGAAVCLMCIGAGDAAIRSLYLPVDPFASWWRLRPTAWLEPRKYSDWWNNHPAWSALSAAADRRAIIVDAPYEQVVLTRLGAHVVPLVSPALAYLFLGDANLNSHLVRLRADGIRFIVRSVGNDVVDAQLARAPFFRALQKHPPTVKFPTCHVYDLYSADLGGPAVPAPASAP